MAFFARHPSIKSLCMLSAKVWTIVVSLAISLGLLTMVIMGGLGLNDQSYRVGGSDWSSNKILSLKISGIIVGDSDGFFLEGLGVTPGYAVKKHLYEAAKNPDVKAVILEVDSPGGTIAGAQAIADGVAYYREYTKNPVYAHVQGMGASGGYWAAASADRVLAEAGSDVGSIGVIMGPFKYYDKVLSEEGQGGAVMTQNGIESYYITAGKSKDAGDPYRRLTKEESDAFQRGVNNEYDRFVKYVSARRKIDEATIREKFGAFTFDNKTAQELKLIDETTGREESYAKLAEAAQLGTDYEVIRPKVLDENAHNRMAWVTSLFGREKQAVAPNACSFTRVNLAYSGDLGALCPSKE